MVGIVVTCGKHPHHFTKRVGGLWGISSLTTPLIYWSAFTKPRELTSYICVRDIDFACFNDFSYYILEMFGSVVFFFICNKKKRECAIKWIIHNQIYFLNRLKMSANLHSVSCFEITNQYIKHYSSHHQTGTNMFRKYFKIREAQAFCFVISLGLLTI